MDPKSAGDERVWSESLQGRHVIVVVLVKASSSYSLLQAHNLDRIHVRISETVGPKVRVIGINSKQWPSNTMINKFHSTVNFTVYQSTPENDLWSKIGGIQDDVFIYDRCGLLAYYVPFPHSSVDRRFVEAAMVSAHFDSPCQCNDSVPSPSSPSSNCTNGTDEGPPPRNHPNTSDGATDSSRRIQVPVPSAQSQQARAHNHPRQPSPPLPPECSRMPRDVCSNNTTHHQRSLRRLKLRCCHLLANRRIPAVPASKCLCLPIDGSHEDSCLCRPDEDTLNGGGGAAARKSCFCQFHKSTVESSCNCAGKYIGGYRECMCSFRKDHLSQHCA